MQPFFISFYAIKVSLGNTMTILVWVVLIILFSVSVVYFCLNRPPQFTTVSETFTSINIEPFVDFIYYINLDHRTDRNDQFMREMEKIHFPREKIKRVSGVYLKKTGHLGCSRSHIKVMEDFIASDHTNCIVFEDDFEFSEEGPRSLETSIQKLQKQKIPYDVCMLAGNEQDIQDTRYPFLKKVNMCTTTSGFMVNKQFAPRLLQNFKEGEQLLEKSYKEGTPKLPFRGEYAIDQYWISLQPHSNWYMFEPKLGKQRSSFSDIGGGIVDYNV
jgi:hypothetical protein